jgi:hypothetical protein
MHVPMHAGARFGREVRQECPVRSPARRKRRHNGLQGRAR